MRLFGGKGIILKWIYFQGAFEGKAVLEPGGTVPIKAQGLCAEGTGRDGDNGGPGAEELPPENN